MMMMMMMMMVLVVVVVVVVLLLLLLMMMIDDGGDDGGDAAAAAADDDDDDDDDDGTKMLGTRWIMTNRQKYWTISHLFRLAERPRIGTGIWGVFSRCPECQFTNVLCRAAKWERWSVQQKLISEHQRRTQSTPDVPALQSCLELDARSWVSGQQPGILRDYAYPATGWTGPKPAQSRCHREWHEKDVFLWRIGYRQSSVLTTQSVRRSCPSFLQAWPGGAMWAHQEQLLWESGLRWQDLQ